MLAQLAKMRQDLERWAGSLDPSCLSVPDATALMSEAAALEAVCSALKALAAARAAEGTGWKSAGHRSAADAIARHTGVGGGSARQLIETGRRLREQPDVRRAALAGRLSPEQTELIAGAVASAPGAAAELLDRARDTSLHDLRSRVAQVKASAAPDLEARHRAVRARRHLRSWTDVDGTWHLRACGTPDDGAQVMAALQPIANQVFESARRRGERESPDAYAFDALLQLATEATGPGTEERTPGGPEADPGPGRTRPARRRRGAPAKILIRIDYDAFLRGVAGPGETCELAGYGPVPVSVVRQVMATGDPFVAAILQRGKVLTGVAHLGRYPTARQQSALEWLYPTCAVSGCAAQAHLERDHREDWSRTRFTMLDLLDLLCPHHHRMKTRYGWALVAGTGVRDFVPPGDPRHPVRAPTPGPAG